MTQFTTYDETNAPADARPVLERTKKALGFVPNLYGVFAENPATLEAYTTLSAIFDKAGFSSLEAQIVLIATSVENDCHFCVAAHSAISAGSGLDADVINALRANQPLADSRLEALRVFTQKVVTERGFVADADVDQFIQAGWTRAAVLGVILGVSLKVISNYTNHVAETALNEQFQAFAWEPRKVKQAEYV